MADEYGRLQVAVLPSIPEQEAQAEAERLKGAASAPENQQSTPYSVPLDTTPTHEVDAQGGDSHQVDWNEPNNQGAGGVNEQHYYIHRVTETVERGNALFNSYTLSLAAAVDGVTRPVQLFGLNDLRTKADVVLCDADKAAVTGAAVYFGDRDVINSDGFSQAFCIGVRGFIEYKSRKEAWIVNNTEDVVSVTVMEYISEPNSDELASRSKSSRGAQ